MSISRADRRDLLTYLHQRRKARGPELPGPRGAARSATQRRDRVERELDSSLLRVAPGEGLREREDGLRIVLARQRVEETGDPLDEGDACRRRAARAFAAPSLRRARGALGEHRVRSIRPWRAEASTAARDLGLAQAGAAAGGGSASGSSAAPAAGRG